jgi:hypothetical protein
VGRGGGRLFDNTTSSFLKGECYLLEERRKRREKGIEKPT